MTTERGTMDDDDFPELPLGVGPHEGRECALMLAGTKPLAMFRDGVGYTHHFPEAVFAPHVARGAIIRREEIHRGAGPVATHCVYFALPGEEWRIEAADAINRGEGRGTASVEEDEIAMGRLLGYSEDEIAAYLEHARGRRRV